MRPFNAQEYIDKKVNAINKFFFRAKLDSVVIGISGGVDSALVLALFVEAAKRPGSRLKQIRCLAMPIHGSGVTGQDATINKGHLLLDTYKDCGILVYRHLDLTDAYNAMVSQAYAQDTSDWTDGQMASVLRTPMFYYQAAILQKRGYKSIVAGTTNRDEGAYIGFFGKASDGMVDLQPIADIHKSEVYKVAELLGVPAIITNDAPRGDVWDNKTDVEMIGAPYSFLQKLVETKCGIYKTYAQDLEQAAHQYQRWILLRTGDEKIWAENIEKLHKTNKHKYQVGSPAHFIDVMERCVPGGWQDTESIIESYRQFVWKNGATEHDKESWLHGHKLTTDV